VLRGNEAMLGLARAFGFAVTRSPHDATMLRITRDLDEDPQRAGRPASALGTRPATAPRMPAGYRV
jgi:hypothetical protein